MFFFIIIKFRLILNTILANKIHPMSHDFLYYVSKKIEKIILFAKCIYFLKSYLILKIYKSLIIRSQDIRGTYYRGTALYKIVFNKFSASELNFFRCSLYNCENEMSWVTSKYPILFFKRSIDKFDNWSSSVGNSVWL